MAKSLINSGLHDRLALFFEQALPLLFSEAEEEAADLQIDRDRFVRFIQQLRAPLNKAEARACSNPWLTAGLGNDEVRVSAALGALWDRRQYGDEARGFLIRFFARAGTGFPDEMELADGYRVKNDHCLIVDVSDLVDITLETLSSFVGIEVKIYAGEGEDQLARYVAAIRSRARLMRRAKHKVIFLAPYSPKGAAEKVSYVTWRTVAEAAAQVDERTHAGWLIGQFGEYCRSLGS